MNERIIEQNGNRIAIIQSNEVVISDVQTALDLMATIDYVHNCQRIIINKQAICEDFFKLSTGVAGEILQKFINYGKKLAIVGDFSNYTSKPLHEFIYECNNGKDIFFVNNEQDAIERCSK